MKNPVPKNTISRLDRSIAALLGALTGDALGVPYEFLRAEDLPPLSALQMRPPLNFRRSHKGVPPGTWSDDGAQMLALLDSLLTRRGYVPSDFIQRLLAWYRQGSYTPDGRVFDVGVQTSSALRKLAAGIPMSLAAPAEFRANGNGSLMRVLPVALLANSAEQAVGWAMDQSLPTHPHELSQACCAFYVLLARELLTGETPAAALTGASSQLMRLARQRCSASTLETVLTRPAKIKGSGFVLDSLWASWTVMESTSSVYDCLQAAVSLGDDTDTTACIAGGLAGARHGCDALPYEWVDQLHGQSQICAVLERLSEFLPPEDKPLA